MDLAIKNYCFWYFLVIVSNGKKNSLINFFNKGYRLFYSLWLNVLSHKLCSIINCF